MTVPFDNWRFDIRSGTVPSGLTLIQNVVVYAGKQADDFSLTVEITGLAGGATVSVLDRTGTVVVASLPAPPTANFIVVRQNDGRIARYYHLLNLPPPVEVGDRVVCGQRLGDVGSSGISATPHLHFEMRDFGTTSAVPTQGLITDVDTASNSAPVFEPFAPNAWLAFVPGSAEAGFPIPLPCP